MKGLIRYTFICHDLDERNVVHSEVVSFECDLSALNHALVLSSDYFNIDVYRRIEHGKHIKVATIY